MVKRFHRAGLEVILDVVYNHTAEGNHRGPTLSFRGIDNVAYYRLDPARPQPLRRLHRLRATRSTSATRGARPGARQPALLGRRDARRRVPLRPRAGARPRRSRRFDPAAPVLRRRAPGPDPRRGEADRRAVGPRSGRLPASAASRRAGRSGTASIRDGVRRFWRGDPGQRRRAGLAAAREQRPVRGRPAGPAGRASTSSPATTGSPCTTS